ncbi:GNAT family N-acetyltransferase [Paenibacillus sp. GCM10023252]|uniref:GNAT family N-acetyltransferase n=1 Tax=Paenibacillus sp. GCM10023252 TaxID=3252649 RepID=UPI0036104671
MIIQQLTPEQWLSLRKRLVGCARSFGDKRLTVHALDAFQQVQAASLLPETAEPLRPSRSIILLARQERRLVGLSFAEDEGEGACMLAVHPEARGQGIARALLTRMAEHWGGRLVCHVAIDNTPSIAACFGAEMVAVAMHTGPTGKPTLRFERSNVHDAARPRHPHTILE